MSVIFDVLNKKISVNKNCIGDVIPQKYLGSGSSGDVVSVCLKNDLEDQSCMYVVKLINLKNLFHIGDSETDPYKIFEKEIAMAQIASKLDIGPKYIKNISCQAKVEEENDKTLEYRFIVMEKYDITLGAFLENTKNTKQGEALIKVLIELCLKCITYQLFHGDLCELKYINYGNVMLKVNSNDVPVKAVLIDFEYSSLPSDKVKDEWCSFFEVLAKKHSFLSQIINNYDFVKKCIK